ncbi:MAG: hypothetical protein JXB36_01945 [Gammaproteobacteria bacterium]|nr:hypothetical protein [Gammaproteobacteria bacterium]
MRATEMSLKRWLLLAMTIVCPVAYAQGVVTAAEPDTAVRESGFVRIGGIDQYITIRGASASNPVLLLIHGGPGDAQSVFEDEYAPYERDFILVQWDQRGSGRTYGRYGDATPSLTLDRHFLAVNQPLRERMGAADSEWLATIRERVEKVATAQELRMLGDGMSFSGRTLFPTQTTEDLFVTASEFVIPFIVIQGEHDLFTPTPIAEEYFDHVRAPRKHLRIIDGAGHFALVTHQREFIAALKAALEG